MEIHPDPFVQGLLNEDRFFDILDRVILAGQAPDWFYSVCRATRFEDSLGIDGFAKVYTRVGEIRRVPFQVKSSDHGIYRHYQDYQIFWMDRLPYFVINPDMGDGLIIHKFFTELHNIRLRNEVFRRVENYLALNGAGFPAGIAQEIQPPSPMAAEALQLSLQLTAG